MNFNQIIQEEQINEYLGSEKKKTVIIGGEQYLLKLPDPVRIQHRSLSYINNAISEYLGCKIFALANIPVQEVILGEYTNERGKQKIVCACKDLRLPNEELITMEAIANSFFEDSPEKNKKMTFDFFELIAKKLPLDTKQIRTFYY